MQAGIEPLRPLFMRFRDSSFLVDARGHALSRAPSRESKPRSTYAKLGNDFRVFATAVMLQAQRKGALSQRCEA